jgi:hypothetical protein
VNLGKFFEFNYNLNIESLQTKYLDNAKAFGVP